MVAKHKPGQLERALDTVSIVGSLVAGQKAQTETHKAEMEMLAAQQNHSLQTVVKLILDAQKAESDAQRERAKAEREDQRERWELERQNRLRLREARIARAQPEATNGKVRRAHA